MATDFPPFVASDVNPAVVMDFTPDTDATMIPGGIVVYDPSDYTIDTVSTDPSAILGMALAKVTAGVIAANVNPSGKVPVLCFQPTTIIGMASATTPTEAHVLVAGGGYGIVVSAITGNMLVDISETTNKCLAVVRVDIPNGIFYVQFHGDHLQLTSAAGALT